MLENVEKVALVGRDINRNAWFSQTYVPCYCGSLSVLHFVFLETLPRVMLDRIEDVLGRARNELHQRYYNDP